MFCETQDIIPTQTITSMVEAYNYSVKSMTEAYRLMASSQKMMNANFGGRARIFSWNRNAGSVDEALKNIKIGSWEYILKQTGVDAVMTSGRRSEFEKQLKEKTDTVPEFTVENILAFLRQLRGDSSKYVEEAIGELYNMLRPWNSDYKTNDKFEVGRKVILERILNAETKYCCLGIDYRQEGDVCLLDNIFHLLDGQGMPKYPNDLVSNIKQGIRDKSWKCETPYFKCKWFKKGTIHIEFKRIDLVTEMNRIAGGGMLKPHNA